MSEKSPITEQFRPQSLNDYVGQHHLLGTGKPLRVCFESGQAHNMIFWGPPGVGKTSLALLASQYFKSDFIALSAVFSGVKDIRQAIEQAQHNRDQGIETILFIDEIHRFNKTQQDALLPYCESGLVTLIGATTENPAFEVNRALLSRCTVYVLKKLGDDDLERLLKKAWAHILNKVELNDEVRRFLIQQADGDARRLLHLLSQLKVYIHQVNVERLELKQLKSFFSEIIKACDKNGDIFYDLISALHKSVRGSNPDASLYWFSRLVDSGVDLKYVSRRIIRMAWEDIGLADPRAIQIANDAAMSYERLGSPEGDLALANAIIYLSVAAKSNAAYKAYKEALSFVKKDISREVPLDLRNAPTALSKQLEYGKNYQYAHEKPHAYAAGASYWPENLKAHQWYVPVNRGLEIKIAEKLKFLKQLDELAKS